jgi:MFS family permease
VLSVIRRAKERIPDRNIWIIYSAILLLGIAYGVSIAVLAVHLKENGIPELAMGGLAVAFALGIITFSIPAGWAVQRFGAKKTLLCALVGYAICVTLFPSLKTTTALSVARFFDGAFSAGVWVAAETALLSRSSTTNKAFVMSLYAMALALGYAVGALLAIGVNRFAGTSGSFIVAGILTIGATSVILLRLAGTAAASGGEHEGSGDGESGTRASALDIVWRIKTACLATFTYGYFQASLVLYLPLFLMQAKGVAKQQTFLVTMFFALGMLLSTTTVSRLGDRFGHLLVMRTLGAIGGTMVGSFVLLSSFELMCGAVFVAGATLAAISPVSLALQGVIIPKHDLGRANGFYNATYAAGMLIGPPISGLLFTMRGGGAMLLHLTALWATFVVVTLIFANDDPRRGLRKLAAATSAK